MTKLRAMRDALRARMGTRRPRVLALTAFRDEMRFLPGFFDSVGSHVDGILALDDGSTDGSGYYAAGRAEVSAWSSATCRVRSRY